MKYQKVVPTNIQDFEQPVFRGINKAFQTLCSTSKDKINHTHQFKTCEKIFNFLIDKATKLELVLFSFYYILIFCFCTFHTSHNIKEEYQKPSFFFNTVECNGVSE